MTAKQELLLAGVTFASTIITGDFIWDLIAGIFVYFASRIIHHYYHKKVIALIDKIKKKLKRLKKK